MILRLLIALILASAAVLWFLGEPDVGPGSKTQLSEMERQLREMNNSVARIQYKSNQAGAKTRQEIDQATKVLHTQIIAANQKLAQLKEAAEKSTLRDRLRRALVKIKAWILAKSKRGGTS